MQRRRHSFWQHDWFLIVPMMTIAVGTLSLLLISIML